MIKIETISTINYKSLDDEIELLDLSPSIFFKIKKHDYNIAVIRDLLKVDLSKIKGIGKISLAVLNKSLVGYLSK